MTIAVSELQAGIKAIPEDIFSLMPDGEGNIFKNYKFFPVDLLVNADWNYKENDEFMQEQLLNNIKRNGQIVTCQVRLLPTGFYEVVDGNHRLRSFQQLGQNYAICYDHGVISQAEAERLAVETNETHFKADLEKLARLMERIKLEFPEEDLSATMPYSDDQMQDMMNSLLASAGISADEVEEDEFDMEPPAVPVTIRGDIYELNGHRILCGDSTKADDVAVLMNGNKAHLVYTDPPYNIDYTKFNADRNKGGKDWNTAISTEWTDLMPPEEYKLFLINFMKLAKEHSIEYAHYYVWHATTFVNDVLAAFDANEIPYDKVPIQWVKQSAPPSWCRYWRITEPCIFGGKGAVTGNSGKGRWFGSTYETNAWLISREHSGRYIHPTQKPLALAVKAIKNSSRAGEIVLDLFIGSASTLVASDIMDRTCYGMEFEPASCDLGVLRFIKYCTDNNKEFEVKRNGEIIDKSFFNYSDINTDDHYVEAD